MPLIDFLYFISMIILMIHMIFHDIKWYKIENHILLLMWFLNMMYMFYKGSFHVLSITNGLFVFVFLIGLRHVMNKRYHKDTLGFGDIKLLSLIAFIMPFYSMPYIVFFASLSTFLVMILCQLKKMPFAPFILISWMGVYVWLFI